jgi:uncharacterized phosphosugar-binding protein
MHPRRATEDMLTELWRRNHPPPRFTDVVINNPGPKGRPAAVNDCAATTSAAGTAGTAAGTAAAAAVAAQDTATEVMHTQYYTVPAYIAHTYMYNY